MIFEKSEETKKKPIKTERVSFSILSILIGFFAPFTSSRSEQKVYVPICYAALFLRLFITSPHPARPVSMIPKR